MSSIRGIPEEQRTPLCQSLIHILSVRETEFEAKREAVSIWANNLAEELVRSILTAVPEILAKSTDPRKESWELRRELQKNFILILTDDNFQNNEVEFQYRLRLVTEKMLSLCGFSKIIKFELPRYKHEMVPFYQSMAKRYQDSSKRPTVLPIAVFEKRRADGRSVKTVLIDCNLFLPW